MSITGLFFLALFATGCVLAMVRRPIYGLITYVASFYVHPPSRWWGEGLPDLRWSFLIAGVTLLATVVQRNGEQHPNLGRQPFFIGILLFVLWIVTQMLWALDPLMHRDLVNYFSKYVIVIVIIWRAVRTHDDLKAFLWAHTLGCGYLGWIAFSEYSGGRFEGFGGPGLGDANAAALQLVTGVCTGAALLLAGRLYERVLAIAVMPFILNAVVTTISRSAFLAVGFAGVVFNIFSPMQFKRSVRLYSLLALVLLGILAGSAYWNRMSTLKYAGEDIVGVDTGGGRLEIIAAQWEMFKAYPLGCGHRCTATLSPAYIEERFLSGRGPDAARSSHNTFMTLLVEQGFIGALAYVAFAWWACRTVFRLRPMAAQAGIVPLAALTAATSTLAAIFMGDMFVDNLKAEVRIWFVAVLLVLNRMTAVEQPRSWQTTNHPRLIRST